MTKQEAVQKVQQEADRLWDESRATKNTIVREACASVAQKLQWAISIFQQVETKED